MAKKTPTPVRFDMAVADRLAVFVSVNHGLSLSAAANMLVDEGLRMMEHPGVLFRTGPTGRRAGLAGGPDVWEVVRAVKSARAAEPDLGEQELLAMLAENTGVPVRMIRVATGCWAAYTDEIDAEIAAADAAEESAEQAWRRERDQLGAKGHDVRAVVADPEFPGLPDEDVLIGATEAGRALVTANIKDFMPLD